MEKIIEEISSIGEENLNLGNLEGLLKSGKEIVSYDGFEPSGRLHISQGLLRTINTNKLTKHGIKFKFWVADWFAMLNHKMGGDLKKIKKAGLLMIETWKACGMKMENVEFLWASDEINARPAEYWGIVLDIATRMNLNRVLRCTQIMGRKSAFETEEVIRLRAENLALKAKLIAAGIDKPENNESVNEKSENNESVNEKSNESANENTDESIIKEKGNSKKEAPMSTSQVFYPCMQAADILFLGVDICSLGMDQRKVNAMALEYCGKIKKRHHPIILSHHMLMGLDGSDKMSKSNPENAIFMDDGPGDVKRKIKRAFCRPGVIEVNPIIEYCQYIILPLIGQIEIKRKEEHGGDLIYTEVESLRRDFAEEKLHPGDLKPAVIGYINQLLDPVRRHFEENKEAKKLLKEVKKYRK